MKLSNIKTADVHAFAKTLGIKNLKSAGRTREIIISEIIELKNWGSMTEELVEFFMKGGTVTECRPQTNDKPDLGNQASAGKTKKKGQTEFDKRGKAYVASVKAAVAKLNNKEAKDFDEYLAAHGLNWLGDMQVWGDGGLCDLVTRWGLKVKLGEKPTEEVKEKVVKEKGERKPRETVKRDGMISLSSLCDKHGIDGKVARRKLRSKMEKPEQGWHFTPEQAAEVELIITK